jgi:hypothetical protein
MMARRALAPLLWIGLVGMGAAAHAASLQATDTGLQVDAGSLGQFTLSYPVLLDEQNNVLLKPIEQRATGAQALVNYGDGGQVEVAIEPDGTMALQFAGLPASVRKYRMDMLIDFSFSEGGTWQVGNAAAVRFPAEKPEKPHLYQGSATTLRLTSFEGRTLSFEVPPYSYQQLQDNREWNWKIFAWFFIAPYNPGASRQFVRVTEGETEGGARRVIVVDRFGQDARLDFPGKVKSEEELKADVAADQAYYDALQPPASDAHGGLPGSGARLGLKQTGYFHVQQAAGRWVLVGPDGNAVFHLGICGFQPSDDYTYIKGREQIYEWLPPYDGEFRTAFHPEDYWSRDAFSFYLANVVRKTGKPFDREAWTADIIGRVRKWGFNATGAFAGTTQAHQTLRFPYVSSLPLSEWQLGRHIPGLRGLFDPFDAATLAKMDELLAQQIAPRADDPLLIGYFLANEQAFEDIPRVIPSLRAGSPAKVRLIEMLQAKYQTIGALNQAWQMEAESFEALRDAGLPVTTQQAADDVQAFTEAFVTEYFRTVAEAFHKHDPHHMLLGNRWQPGTAINEALCRIAGQYVDVLSLNYYAYGVDKAFLDRLHGWTGDKPMMLSEFYWASPSDTGLPGGKEVGSQRERGLAYRNYVEQAAAMPYIVGIEWFTLIDQARSGRWFERYNGERANTGLLSVTDRPYRDCLAEMMAANYGVYQVMFGERSPFAYNDPRFAASGQATRTLQIPRAPGPIALDGRRDDWPGTPPERLSPGRLVEGAEAGGLEAAFRLCWDATNLYLLAEVTDSTPMQNSHQGDSIWSGDALELFLGHEGLDRPGTLLFTDRQVLLSGGLVDGATHSYIAHAPQQVPCALAVTRNVDGRGYVLEAAIPFAAFGLVPTAGRALLFDLALDDSADGQGRLRQLMWNGTARNSSDRTHWGRAVLGE